MLILWVVGIFLWLYALPFVFLSSILWTPFVLLSLPICYVSTLFLDDSEYVRTLLSKMPYHWWFGAIDRPNLPNTPHLIAYHPHGVFCIGAIVGLHLQPGGTTKFAVSPWLFTVPVVGTVAVMLGCIPATKKSILNALKKHSVILVPGGVPELVTGELYTRRFGFLKLGVPILPVVCKSEFYTVLDIGFKDIRIHIAKEYGIPIMFPWIFGWHNTWVPRRVPIKLSVLDIHRVSGPIEDEHASYFSSLSSHIPVVR